MQPSSNMSDEQAEMPSVSVSVTDDPIDFNDLVLMSKQDVFTEDALLDLAIDHLSACIDWIAAQQGYDVKHLSPSHPLAQALYFLRQFDDPSSLSENG